MKSGRSWSKKCGGSNICEHNRKRSKCKQCGGSSIYEHYRTPSIYEHNRTRSQRKQCGSRPEHLTVSTTAQEASASNAAARASVSTISKGEFASPAVGTHTHKLTTHWNLGDIFLEHE
jgi:hypothetical protein